MKGLEEILKLADEDDYISNITIDKVIHSKKLLLLTPKSNNELMQVLVAMNLINAALKRKEFKSKDKDALIHYGMLKPKISRLFHHILDNPKLFDISFYINAEEKCAYIEIESLQFSFHNIILDEQLKKFIKSKSNNPEPWKGIRLQKIAVELFDYFVV